MRITFTGHAGMLIETRGVSILCDPWFTPAYFASWFPFPANDGLDLDALATPDYLYVSHLHHDHFDPAHLRDRVSKETQVILPDYPVDHLRRAMEGLGFHRFVETRSGVPRDCGPLRVAVIALTAPTDGPIGDSSLIVDDGEVSILNQNDARPTDIDAILSLGPFNGHFLQYSGAIWYPMVYRMPERAKRALGERKRANQLSRALRYVEQIGASYVFPSAGPACFLDDDLFHLNDVDGDPANIFPDQTVFIEHLRERGHDEGRLLLPGSVAELGGGRCEVTHPEGGAELDRIFGRGRKREYLEEYARRMRPRIEEVMSAWPRGAVDIVPTLRGWFEPLMDLADLTSAGIGGTVVIDHGDGAVALDFHRRRVEAWSGGEWDYRFHIARPLLESVIRDRCEDWVNELFLSCRFEAERKGGYNEYVYNFFKSLSVERIEYLEGYLAEEASPDELWDCGGYRIQRRCPHLKADLARFAQIDGDVLTCTMHGWQFELSTGRCLTSDDRRLYTQPLSEAPPAAPHRRFERVGERSRRPPPEAAAGSSHDSEAAELRGRAAPAVRRGR